MEHLSVQQLMLLYRKVGTELIARDVCRTRNSPTGDIAEYLFSRTFGWKLEPNSRTGYDAISATYGRVQIKSRFLSAENSSRQAGDIRQLDQKKIDWLAAVVFDPAAEIKVGFLIPHSSIVDAALSIEHTNSSRIYLREDWLEVPGVVDVTEKLKETWALLNNQSPTPFS